MGAARQLMDDAPVKLRRGRSAGNWSAVGYPFSLMREGRVWKIKAGMGKPVRVLTDSGAASCEYRTRREAAQALTVLIRTCWDEPQLKPPRFCKIRDGYWHALDNGRMCGWIRAEGNGYTACPTGVGAAPWWQPTMTGARDHITSHWRARQAAAASD